MSHSKESRSKLRLYVVLYARAAGGGPRMPEREDTYHWALLLGPKDESSEAVKGVKMHANDRVRVENGAVIQTFKYEEIDVSLAAVSMIVARVLVGKFPTEKRNSLLDIIRVLTIGIREEEWNCVSFVRDALAALDADGTVLSEKSIVEWKTVRNGTMKYAERKKAQHRFDGQGEFEMRKVPTCDLMRGKELIP